MKLLIMALRNLNRHKKWTFLLGGAIAFGIFVITMINGFTGSFVENVGENFSHILAGHIFIDGVEKTESGKNLSVIRDDSVLIDTIDELGISYEHIAKRSRFSGTLIFGKNAIMQQIIGIRWGDETFLTERLILKDGSFDNMSDSQGIIISDKIAEKLDVEIGDRFLVQMKTITGQQNVGEFVLAAISYDPGLFGSLSGYANIEYVNELLSLAPGEYMSLSVMLDQMVGVDETADNYFDELSTQVSLFERNKQQDEEINRIRAMMNQADDETWEGTKFRLYTINDMLVEVKQMVDLLNGVSFIFLLILFFVIMVGITNTFRRIMLERIKEIGTMRALGMQRFDVGLLFVLEAFFLGVSGALSGLLIAGLSMFIISQYFWGLDSILFVLLRNGYMTFKVLPQQLLFNVSVIAGLTIFAAFFPALKAARLKPVEALRSAK